MSVSAATATAHALNITALLQKAFCGATGDTISKIAKKAYNLYAVTISYPAKPLSALWGPALTASNYLAPDLLKKIASVLPEFVQGAVAYDADGEAVCKEAALALLFISLTRDPSIDNRQVSIAIMGLLASLI
jgi:hypothetical protein